MTMRFQRSWDFNPGNKKLMLNDLTQDSEVIAALQEALTIAVTGVADQIPYSNLISQLQAVNVQAAIDEVLAKHEDLAESVEGVIGGAGLNAEGVMDLLGTTGLVAGDNVTLTYDDEVGTLTLDVVLPAPGLDAEGVRDTLGATLMAGENITLTVDDGADTITIDAAGGGGGAGLFRGEWVSDSLLGVVDLSGAVLPTGLTGSAGPASQMPAKTTVAAANKGVAPPGSGDAWRMTINREHTDNFSRLAVDMAVLGYTNVTRLAAYTAGTSVGSCAELERKNGSTVQQVALGHNWSQVSIPCDSNDVIDFAAVGLGTNASAEWFGDAHLWVARLEVYGTPAPYMLNECVVYRGKLWKSDTDNNAGVPGVSGWTEVPLLSDAKPLTWGAVTTGNVASGNVVPVLPAHKPGDLLLFMGFRNDSGTINVPAGWNDVFGGPRNYLRWKIAGAAEVAPTFVVGDYCTWIMAAVSGGTSPTPVSFGWSDAGGQQVAIPDLQGSKLVGVFGGQYSAQGAPPAAPAGWTRLATISGSAHAALYTDDVVSAAPVAALGGFPLWALSFGIKDAAVPPPVGFKNWAQVRHSAGDFVRAASPTFVVIDGAGALDTVVNAAAGDLIEISTAFRPEGGGSFVLVDFATMVAGVPVNSVAKDGAWTNTSPNSYGGWSSGVQGSGGGASMFDGTKAYVVKANDISNGQVRFRPYYISGAGTTFKAADPYFYILTRNLGQ